MDLDPALLERIIEALPTPVSVIDPHGRQLAANTSFAVMLGYAPDEIESFDVGRITRTDDQQWTRDYLLRLTTGEIDEYLTDKVYVRKDGTELPAHLHARALRDDDGSCVALIAAITPRDDALTTDHDVPLGRLLEFIDDTLTVVDEAGAVLETSGRHTDVLGYPPSFWQRRSILDLLDESDVGRVLEMRDQLLRDPATAIETEVEVRAADGSPQTLLVRAVNCLDDPEIGGLVISTRNVTDFRATVAELSRERASATEIAAERSRLLATVSHELRNPLHAVLGHAELLESEPLGDRQRQLVSSLTRQLSHLSTLVGDLLESAELDAAGVRINPTPVEIEDLVDRVVEFGRSGVGERPLTIASHVDLDVPKWVLADEARLRQILANLMGNAVKFTDEGSVHLTVRRGSGGTLVCSVVDTGVGIPPDEVGTILQPFVSASTAGNRRGSGLGLSVVSRLVTAMGGRVDVESTLGVGTRFDVSLPLRAADEPGVVDHGSTAHLEGVALVVEDNPVNQDLARRQLERLGLVPIVVGSGEEALDVVDDLDVSELTVILMDEQLPGMSGVDTTAALRALDGPISSVPIVGVSASTSPDDRERFLAAGMDELLPKPASLSDLGATIRTVVGRRHELMVEASGELGAEEPPQSVAHVARLEPDTAIAPVPTDDAATGELSLGLGRLVEELGSRETVVGLVTIFLGELDQRVAATAADDRHEAARAAHSLRSSAQLLGAGELAELCRSIERGEPASQLVDTVEQVRSCLQEWLGAPS